MKASTIAACATVAFIATACDSPKERVTGKAPVPAAAAAPAAAATLLSEGLPLKPGYPGFYLDHVGTAADPLNKPAIVDGREALVFDGFGFDPDAKTPAKGVDVEIDGRLYPAAYGIARADVADFHKNPALVPVGFKMTLPPGTLAAGPHQVRARFVAADGSAYYQSPVINFTVR